MNLARKVDPPQELSTRISFLRKDAREFGTHEAIFMNWLRFWVKKNQEASRNYIEGKTWSWQSQANLAKDLEWTRNQVRRVIDSLVKQGVIVVGNFNRYGPDKTGWYSFTDESRFLDGGDSHPRLVEKHQGLVEKHQAIPVKNLNQKPKDIRTQPPAEAGAVVSTTNCLPLRSKEEVREMSEATSDRLKAFQAVRGGKQKSENTGPDQTLGRFPEKDEGRGDLARRQERDNRAGKPRKGRPRPEGAAISRGSLRCPIFEAWAAAMKAADLWTSGVADKRDVADAKRLMDKLGPDMTEADGIAYAVWLVENWGTLTKKWPKLNEYPRTSFGIISSRWMDSFVPVWQATATTGGGAKVQGTEFFREYMALPLEEQAVRDPQKEGRIRDVSELMKAYDAYQDAKSEMRRRTK